LNLEKHAKDSSSRSRCPTSHPSIHTARDH
jgi:hypothetical protein